MSSWLALSTATVAVCTVCSGVFINTTHANVDTIFQLHFFNALTKAKADALSNFTILHCL